MFKSLNPPRIPAPPASTTHFSTLRSEVRAGAIRVDIRNPEHCSPGEKAILKNQEAKQVRDIGSLIFETRQLSDWKRWMADWQ